MKNCWSPKERKYLKTDILKIKGILKRRQNYIVQQYALILFMKKTGAVI